MRLLAFTLLIGGSVLLAACSRPPSASPDAGFRFPEGDPVAGRAVFERARCATCHGVAGHTFPAPIAQPEAIRFTQETAAKSVDDLAQSIINPSHSISGGPTGVAEGGERSRMGDFSQSLSIKDVADLVAFLKTIEGL